MIIIKTDHEVELMRDAGKELALVHEKLAELIRPGISTFELDRKAEEYIRSAGCIPTEKGFEGYPASICASVNDVVVHGIPSKSIILKEGDIIAIDTTLAKKGYQADAARTYPVGKISAEAERLIKVTRESFYEGIKHAMEGSHLYDISAAIEDHVVKNGYSCVRDLTGHGIGKDMHEDPMIPNFHQKRRGPRLEKNMTLAIEPMVNAGRFDVNVLDDDWTVVTEDGSLSAHYENTVLITAGDPEILTLTSSEK
jgi:methionyl aminopeptidase